MKKTILLLWSCLFLSQIIYAQDSTIAVSRNKYVQTDFGIGYLNSSMGSINTYLKSQGYKPVKEHYVTLSVSTTYFLNRFLFRGEFSAMLPNSEVQPDNVRTDFRGYTIGAGIGYAVIQTPRFRLYPYAGVTSFNTKLMFTDLSDVANMDDLVNNGHKTAEIRFSNASLDLGIQLEKMIPLKNNRWACPQNSNYLTIGARLGYNLSPDAIKARYNGSQLNGAPEYKFQGPYVKVIIGFGTKIRDLKWK